jgi:DNA mismatch repair protein MutS
VREGPSDNSYGIHVAKLAGLPAETISAAERILASLNAAAAAAAEAETAVRAGQAPAAQAPAGQGTPAEVTAGAGHAAALQAATTGQPLLFDPADLVLRELRGLRVDGMTPLDALNRIARWKEELGRGRDAG